MIKSIAFMMLGVSAAEEGPPATVLSSTIATVLDSVEMVSQNVSKMKSHKESLVAKVESIRANAQDYNLKAVGAKNSLLNGEYEYQKTYLEMEPKALEFIRYKLGSDVSVSVFRLVAGVAATLVFGYLVSKLLPKSGAMWTAVLISSLAILIYILKQSYNF